MPSLNDFSDDEEDDKPQGGESLGGVSTGGGGGGAGPRLQQASKQKAPEFVGWNRISSANQDVSQREAGRLQSNAKASVDAFTNKVNAAESGFGQGIQSNYQQPGAHRQANPAAAPNPAAAGFGGFGAAPQPIQKKGFVTAQAVANGPAGAKSLEASVGPGGWSQLSDAATKADHEATALGSEAGVQGVLQSQAATPTNSALDAALITQAGGQGFRDFAKQQGGGLQQQGLVAAQQRSQDSWNALSGDVSAAQAQKAAADAAAAEAARPRPAGPAAPAAPAEGERQVAGGGTYAELMSKVAGFAKGTTVAKDVLDRIVNSFSMLSMENWQHLGDLMPQLRIGEDIAGSYGLSPEQAKDAFKQFLGSVDPKVAEWILGLTANAGSDTGKAVGNFFGGWGDALHGLTAGTNSSDEEWAAFQQLFQDWMQNSYGKEYQQSWTAPAAAPTTPQQTAAVGTKTGMR